MGLKYDDLLMEEREDVQKVSRCNDLSDRSPFICYFEEVNHSYVIFFKAISRLSEREQYDRAFRLRTAIQQSILHKGLPKEQWVTSEQVHFTFPSSLTYCRVDL